LSSYDGQGESDREQDKYDSRGKMASGRAGGGIAHSHLSVAEESVFGSTGHTSAAENAVSPRFRCGLAALPLFDQRGRQNAR